MLQQIPESIPRWIGQRPTVFVTLFFIVGLLLIGLATASSSTRGLPENGLAEFALPVHIGIAIPRPGFTVEREVAGRIEARRSSQVGFELTGQIARVHADEGDRVAAGSPLAQLDIDRLLVRRTELEAQKARASAALSLAHSTAERVREARELDAVAAQQLDEAEIEVRVKRAQLEEAASSVERIDVEIRKSRLEAPFDAIVARRLVDEGDVVAAGQPVLHLLESRALEARIGLAGEAVREIEVGETYELTIEGEPFDARARAILPRRRPGTRSVEAIFTLLDPRDSIRDGDLARIKIERFVSEPGFWLPISALTESSRGLWAVFTLEGAPDGDRIGRRELEVLHQVEDRAYVRGTLAAGDRFVVDGRHRLTPGLPVSVAAHAEPFWDPEVTR